SLRHDNHRVLEIFFFSSRRRHTRWPRDWSSDVCSSDLNGNWSGGIEPQNHWKRRLRAARRSHVQSESPEREADDLQVYRHLVLRSEERRVGKESRCLWWGWLWRESIT